MSKACGKIPIHVVEKEKKIPLGKALGNDNYCSFSPKRERPDPVLSVATL